MYAPSINIEQNFTTYQPTKNLILHKEDKNNKFYLKAWTLRSKKPFANYSFTTKENREKYENDLITMSLNKIKDKEARKIANQATPEKLNKLYIGMIFYTIWGYEQTNVDFYQVTDIKNKTVSLRKISKKIVEETSWASGMCVANKDDFISNDIIKKIVKFKGDEPYLNFEHDDAKIWEGKKVFMSWYA